MIITKYCENDTLLWLILQYRYHDRKRKIAKGMQYITAYRHLSFQGRTQQRL